MLRDSELFLYRPNSNGSWWKNFWNSISYFIFGGKFIMHYLQLWLIDLLRCVQLGGLWRGKKTVGVSSNFFFLIDTFIVYHGSHITILPRDPHDFRSDLNILCFLYRFFLGLWGWYPMCLWRWYPIWVFCV